uniref:menaquinone-dependent protoporphyrinogen IX dehydrogenase n=1 Tax=Acinetobacter oleivorans TaxID=1148157 RepID=UPI001231524B
FSSVDVQTFKICNAISHILANDGYQIDIVSINECSKIKEDYVFILIGASIRYGNYHKSVYKFIEDNLYTIEQTANGFLSVSATARKVGRDDPLTDIYIQKLKKRSGWTPCLVKIIAGAIDYPQYKLFDRFMIQMIMLITNGPIDTTTRFEFTNWHKVRLFSLEISNKLKS